MKFITVQVLDEDTRLFGTGYVTMHDTRAVLPCPSNEGCTSICWANATRIIVKGTPEEVMALEPTHEF